MRTHSSIEDAYEQAPCGLVTTTIDGTIIRVNATFCTWCGFQAADLINRRRIQDLLTVGGKVFHQTHWAPLLLMQRSVAEVKLERSEEHTSELQSLRHLVCRLLLEKKKT